MTDLSETGCCEAVPLATPFTPPWAGKKASWNWPGHGKLPASSEAPLFISIDEGPDVS
jgi:hypothetical protein